MSLSTECCSDRDDVALKNCAKYFLHPSHEEKEHAEKPIKLQNQRGRRIFLQGIKKPDREDWENGLNAMECALCLGRSVNQSLLELHKLAAEKNDPRLCDFTETHYLNEQVGAIQELGDHVTSLRKVGPWIWHGRVPLWQARPGTVSAEPQAGFPQPRVTPLVTKAVHAHSGYLHLFCKLWQNIYLSSFFSTIPSNKIFWYPQKILKNVSWLTL